MLQRYKLLNFKCICFPFQCWFCWHQVYSLSSNVFRENIHIGLGNIWHPTEFARCPFRRCLSLPGSQPPGQSTPPGPLGDHGCPKTSVPICAGDLSGRHLQGSGHQLQLQLSGGSWNTAFREASSSAPSPSQAHQSITGVMVPGRRPHTYASWDTCKECIYIVSLKRGILKSLQQLPTGLEILTHLLPPWATFHHLLQLCPFTFPPTTFSPSQPPCSSLDVLGFSSFCSPASDGSSGRSAVPDDQVVRVKSVCCALPVPTIVPGTLRVSSQ